MLLENKTRNFDFTNRKWQFFLINSGSYSGSTVEPPQVIEDILTTETVMNKRKIKFPLLAEILLLLHWTNFLSEWVGFFAFLLEHVFQLIEFRYETLSFGFIMFFDFLWLIYTL